MKVGDKEVRLADRQPAEVKMMSIISNPSETTGFRLYQRPVTGREPGAEARVEGSGEGDKRERSQSRARGRKREI